MVDRLLEERTMFHAPMHYGKQALDVWISTFNSTSTPVHLKNLLVGPLLYILIEWGRDEINYLVPFRVG